MTPNFNKSENGLIPVIIQDNLTNVVLMLGYMNAEAFEKTKKEQLYNIVHNYTTHLNIYKNTALYTTLHNYTKHGQNTMRNLAHS